jgi:hypothetical protein
MDIANMIQDIQVGNRLMAPLARMTAWKLEELKLGQGARITAEQIAIAKGTAEAQVGAWKYENPGTYATLQSFSLGTWETAAIAHRMAKELVRIRGELDAIRRGGLLPPAGALTMGEHFFLGKGQWGGKGGEQWKGMPFAQPGMLQGSNEGQQRPGPAMAPPPAGAAGPGQIPAMPAPVGPRGGQAAPAGGAPAPRIPKSEMTPQQQRAQGRKDQAWQKRQAGADKRYRERLDREFGGEFGETPSIEGFGID